MLIRGILSFNILHTDEIKSGLSILKCKAALKINECVREDTNDYYTVF